MRILFTTTPGARNFGPVRTFAQAWQRLGHEVMVVVDPSGSDMVSEAGLDCHPLDPDVPAGPARRLRGHRRRRSRPSSPTCRPRDRGVRHGARRRGDRRAGGAGRRRQRHRRSWPRRPSPRRRSTRCAPSSASRAIRRARGSSPGAGITLIPAALEDPAAHVTLERFRGPEARGRAGCPTCGAATTSPLAHLTLGARQTAVHRVTRSSSSRRCEMRVLVSLGAGQDPAELGPLPGGAHVNPGMPLIDTMPYTGRAGLRRRVEHADRRPRRAACRWSPCRCPPASR